MYAGINSITFVRHGQSEGNIVYEQPVDKAEQLFNAEFKKTTVHSWRLTEKGKEQARQIGSWLLYESGTDFDTFVTSPYTRTRETAALINYPGSKWAIEQRLRERDWGHISALPTHEYATLYPQNYNAYQNDAVYCRPPNGESIRDIQLRVASLMNTWGLDTHTRSVLAVTHGGFMWAARAEIEGLSNSQIISEDKDPASFIDNCCVIQYSFVSPNTSEAESNTIWKRSLCPWKIDETKSDWKTFQFPTYTSEELLSQIETE